jgi:hypothetical protein
VKFGNRINERTVWSDFRLFMLTEMRQCSLACTFPLTVARFAKNPPMPKKDNAHVSIAGYITGVDTSTKRIQMDIHEIGFISPEMTTPSSSPQKGQHLLRSDVIIFPFYFR